MGSDFSLGSDHDYNFVHKPKAPTVGPYKDPRPGLRAAACSNEMVEDSEQAGITNLFNDKSNKKSKEDGDVAKNQSDSPSLINLTSHLAKNQSDSASLKTSGPAASASNKTTASSIISSTKTHCTTTTSVD